jgi:hypothetical protein
MQINHILKFQELLSITINHGYYYNNRCNDFIFEIENETMETIKEYGILVKLEQNKLILIIDVNKDFNHFCYLGEMELNFKIINKNPQFLNFTELPFISNQCIEFEQIKERELLHAAENVTIENCHESISTNGINGKINLRLNKENELFGLFSSEKNKFLTTRHSINFKERNVYWKYFIYGPSRYMEEADYLCIVEKNKKNSITFISKGMVKLPNGKDGYLFISEKTLPLKERPNNQFGLYLNKNKNTENQLIKSLPCPNPTSVQYDKKEEKLFVQEFIFI